MSVITITLNIDTESGDDSTPFCSLIEILNTVKERIRVSNYSLDKYSLDTFEVMHDNDRGVVVIIGPSSKPTAARERALALKNMAAEAQRLKLD